jgi:hypothetical protein
VEKHWSKLFQPTMGKKIAFERERKGRETKDEEKSYKKKTFFLLRFRRFYSGAKPRPDSKPLSCGSLPSALPNALLPLP